MKRRKRRPKPPALVPRRGPVTNLRPVGAHESIKRYNRRKLKNALRQELAEGVLAAPPARASHFL